MGFHWKLSLAALQLSLAELYAYNVPFASLWHCYGQNKGKCKQVSLCLRSQLDGSLFHLRGLIDFLCLQATDPDAGVNGQVWYKLVNQVGMFRINSSGSIFTAVPLDREAQSRYSLIVEASDGAPDPRRATTRLAVEVLDVDDNSPVFSQSAYAVAVPENSPVGTAFLQLLVSRATRSPRRCSCLARVRQTPTATANNLHSNSTPCKRVSRHQSTWSRGGESGTSWANRQRSAASPGVRSTLGSVRRARWRVRRQNPFF